MELCNPSSLKLSAKPRNSLILFRGSCGVVPEGFVFLFWGLCVFVLRVLCLCSEGFCVCPEDFVSLSWGVCVVVLRVLCVFVLRVLCLCPDFFVFLCPEGFVLLLLDQNDLVLAELIFGCFLFACVDILRALLFVCMRISHAHIMHISRYPTLQVVREVSLCMGPILLIQA